MSVVLSIEDAGSCRKQLTIEVPAPVVAAESGRVVARYARKLNLPGFRKGKVPIAMVRQRFKKDIEKDVVEQLVPRFWHQAQAEKDLDALTPPRVEEYNLVEGEPMTFVATVEVRPEITLGDIRDFDLPSDSVEPGQDEIEAALDDLRRQRAEWVSCGRPAAQGDSVRGTITELEDGEEKKTDELTVEIGDANVWEELSLALTGREAGQAATFTRREEGEEGAAKARTFRLDIEAVEERDLPPLDDAFAAKVGDFEDVEALRKAVAEQLRYGKQRDLAGRRQKALLDQLITRHPLEALPQGVVERQTEKMLHDYLMTLSEQGIDVRQMNLDWEAMARDIKPQAERQVHARLVLFAVAKAESLEVGEEELENVLASIAAQRQQSVVALRHELGESGRLEELREQLLREKTIRHLLGETPASEETDGAADTDGT